MNEIWHPMDDGLSVSGLNLWLQDRFAFKARYLEGYEEVLKFTPALAYGNLMQCGIEGYIKGGRQKVSLIKYIKNEYDRLVEEHGAMEDIDFWANLAIHEADLFTQVYDNDPVLPLSEVTDSERNVRVECPLPSGRSITLNCYLDGEGDGLIMENKVRGNWWEEGITHNIYLDLQVNYYLLAVTMETGETPKRVWYQHSLRPGSRRGPRKTKAETQTEYLERCKTWMSEHVDETFFRYVFQPTPTDLQRFCHASLYPMLEAFLDWYEYHEEVRLGGNPVNKFDWMSPYGQYNPFVEGTAERFREYRLTGQPIGLRKRVN